MPLLRCCHRQWLLRTWMTSKSLRQVTTLWNKEISQVTVACLERHHSKCRVVYTNDKHHTCELLQPLSQPKAMHCQCCQTYLQRRWFDPLLLVHLETVPTVSTKHHHQHDISKIVWTLIHAQLFSETLQSSCQLVQKTNQLIEVREKDWGQKILLLEHRSASHHITASPAQCSLSPGPHDLDIQPWRERTNPMVIK